MYAQPPIRMIRNGYYRTDTEQCVHVSGTRSVGGRSAFGSLPYPGDWGWKRVLNGKTESLRSLNVYYLGRKGRTRLGARKMPERWKDMQEWCIRESRGMEQNGPQLNLLRSQEKGGLEESFGFFNLGVTQWNDGAKSGLRNGRKEIETASKSDSEAIA